MIDTVKHHIKLKRINNEIAVSQGQRILQKAEEFLISHIKQRNFMDETVHPWRKDGRQLILHSYRVSSYAIKIIHTERSRLSDEEILMIRLAAILHDIGKFYRKEKHAQTSAKIVEAWMERIDSRNCGIDRERLINIIRGHSDKGAMDYDLCSIILKDADILDEIGAISIFMASDWLDHSSPYFFHELSARVEDYEITFCEKNYRYLGTECAKEIMKDKMAFIKGFVKQLNGELEGTEEFYELLRDKV